MHQQRSDNSEEGVACGRDPVVLPEVCEFIDPTKKSEWLMPRDITWCPRQDSNLRSRLRRAVLYPLSYEGETCETAQ
jgi:hypothetical protein